MARTAENLIRRAILPAFVLLAGCSYSATGRLRAAPSDPFLMPLIEATAPVTHGIVFDAESGAHTRVDDAEVLRTIWYEMNVKQVDDGFLCLCAADLVIYYFQAEKFLAAVGVQEGPSPSWVNGDFDGDLLLEEESKRRLSAWVGRLRAAGRPVDAESLDLPSLD